MSRSRNAWWGSLFAASCLVGCSAAKSGGDGGDELVDAGDVDADHDTGSFAALDTGGRTGADSPSGFDVAKGDTPGGDDTSCAATSSTATQVPLDLFVMQDQSGSMKEATSTGASKWDAVKAAFKAFMSDPTNAGIGVGIQYFGLNSLFGFGGSSCTPSDYAKPEVEMAPLPGVEAAILSSLGAHSPSTDTPTGPALQGAIDHARAWQAANPSHVVVVVLATDGLPTACAPQDIPSIAAIAAAAAAGKPSLRTFVIGVLADGDIGKGADTNLNQISKAGNGSDAFIIKTSTTDVAAAFAKALSAIRGTTLACSYVVPTGAGADYGKVNVVVDLGKGPETIPYVGAVAGCTAAGGWYYDVDPKVAKPTQVIMCDASCAKLQAAGAGGKIDIQVGCATIGPK